MQNFLFETKLLAIEWRAFRDRTLAELEWTDIQLGNRLTGKTELSKPERVALEKILADLRREVLEGDIDLFAYNSGKRFI